MSSGIQINNDNFQAEIIESSIPVLVDFWAGWCNPCKMISPLLDQLASEYSGRIKIGKINVDEETDLASKHSIVSIPTLVLYQGGKIVRQQVGAISKREIENMFKDLIK